MRDIALCHPRMQKIAAQWITACKAEGINVAISETLRTAAEQDALYAKGRTKPGNIVTNAKGSSYRSQHQWGIAFDFYLKMDVDGVGVLPQSGRYKWGLSTMLDQSPPQARPSFLPISAAFLK